MKASNTKISNLDFANGTPNGTVNETFADFTTGFEVTITISKISEDYAISKIATSSEETSEAFITKMQRFVDIQEYLDETTADRKLDRLQYYSRKEIKGMEAITMEEEVAVEVVETVEEVVKTETFVGGAVVTEGIKAPKQAPKVGLEATIFNFVKEGIESEESLETVTYHIKKTLDELGVVPGKLEHHVTNDRTEKTINVGTQHELFGRVLKSISARVNIALVGPAGSGKTTAIINSAKALDLPFYSKSLSEHTGVHEFFGYQDAHGNYVTTDFRKAFEFGGVWLGDEFDNSNPNVLSAINQASENEVVSFPDAMVERHEDFVCIMAGNTFGHGATSEYVGRNPIDAATLDRFAFLYFGYDNAMEMELAPNKGWCSKVQALRAIVATKKIKTIISPRATFNGSKLLKAGLTEQEVMQMTIYKGMSQAEIEMLKN
jgi:cobaltochelatase CobS